MTRLTITPQGDSYRVYNHSIEAAYYVNDIVGVDIPDNTRQLKLQVDDYEIGSDTLTVEE